MFTVQGLELNKVRGFRFSDGFDLIFNQEELDLLHRSNNVDEFYKEVALIMFKMDRRIHSKYVGELFYRKGS